MYVTKIMPWVELRLPAFCFVWFTNCSQYTLRLSVAKLHFYCFQHHLNWQPLIITKYKAKLSASGTQQSCRRKTSTPCGAAWKQAGDSSDRLSHSGEAVWWPESWNTLRCWRQSMMMLPNHTVQVFLMTNCSLWLFSIKVPLMSCSTH